jgi:hypothetical protein
LAQGEGTDLAKVISQYMSVWISNITLVKRFSFVHIWISDSFCFFFVQITKNREIERSLLRIDKKWYLPTKGMLGCPQ